MNATATKAGILLAFTLFICGCEKTPTPSTESANLEDHIVKRSCAWSFNAPDDVFGKQDLCVGTQGEILGVVRNEQGRWLAYSQGVYCENSGSGFINRAMAQACIARVFDVKEKLE